MHATKISSGYCATGLSRLKKEMTASKRGTDDRNKKYEKTRGGKGPPMESASRCRRSKCGMTMMAVTTSEAAPKPHM